MKVAEQRCNDRRSPYQYEDKVHQERIIVSEIRPLTTPDASISAVAATRNRRSSETGFTLIDLMISVAIIGILAAISVSAYWNYVLETRIMGATNILANTLHQARIDAAAFGEPVSVCPSNNGATCTGSPWQEGWIAFTDNGAPGAVDGSDFVLRSAKPTDSKLDLTIDTAAPFVRFLPNKLSFV
ncbi:MAG: GspH/FimT family pseudopilin [Acidiferrobacterales bacterium]